MTTKAQKQKRALASFIDCASDLQSDFNIWSIRGAIPPEWDDMDMLADVAPAKERVTIRMDQDVVRYFRALGPGYTTQINKVLRTFVMGRISNAIYARDEGLSVTDIASGYRMKSVEELEMEEDLVARMEAYRARRRAHQGS